MEEVPLSFPSLHPLIVTYGYDFTSQFTSITYQLGTTTLGGLTQRLRSSGKRRFG